MGIPALSLTAFKKREREVGNALEWIAKRTFRSWMKKPLITVHH